MTDLAGEFPGTDPHYDLSLGWLKDYHLTCYGHDFLYEESAHLFYKQF